MNNFLPSKKFIFTLLAIILAIGLIYTSIWLKQKDINTNIPNQEKEKNIDNFKNIDSDNDGLLDWEEILRGTDLYNPDTDGDKTSDGEEITLNRDPLKANTAETDQEPNDKLTTEEISLIKKEEEEFKSLSTTAQVSRELFLQYLNTKRNGIPLTEEEKQMIVKRALTYIPEITFTKYTNKDIKVSNTNELDLQKDYANNVAKIFLTNLGIKTETVDSIINDWYEYTSGTTTAEGITKLFSRFDPLINKNQQTVLALKALEVPNIFTQEHLDLLNAVSEIYEKLVLMKKSSNDTIIFYYINRSYYESVKNLAEALKRMTLAIANSQIVFTSKQDTGYQFFGVIMSMP